MGTWRWEIGSEFVDWDTPMEELFGFGPGTFPGTMQAYLDCLHPEDRPEVEERLRQMQESTPTELTVEHRIVIPGKRLRWISIVAKLLPRREGRRPVMTGMAVDVTRRQVAETARKMAEAAEAQARRDAMRSHRRLAMLAKASQLLAAPLDLRATLEQVAELAVDSLADWCLIILRPRESALQTVVAHRDPSMADLSGELHRGLSEVVRDPALQPRFCNPRTICHPRFDDSRLRAYLADEGRCEVVGRLRITSVVVVPLISGSTPMGSMILLTTHGRELTDSDAELAEELGRRAGSATEKVQLYAERDRVARTLQSALLPPQLPTLPWAELGAFYQPWTAGMDVGGDFFDVVRTERTVWLVLGDVCGKGPAAAAMTAAARYALRALVLADDDPARVLEQLNQVLLQGTGCDDSDERFITLVLARMIPYENGLVIRMASAGHPPPLIRRGDGTVQSVLVPGMPLGLFPQGETTSMRLWLDPDDALLLYTDGATEARDTSGCELGESTLRQILAGPCDSAAGLVERVSSEVLERVGALRDDLALLAVRVPGN
ncbi:MAG: SpoIIE family protein phosphatase [Actinomycetota bacterium]|nr:SpoIIE family protein phosphatase [Actinomycetota bacterium]